MAIQTAKSTGEKNIIHPTIAEKLSTQKFIHFHKSQKQNIIPKNRIKTCTIFIYYLLKITFRIAFTVTLFGVVSTSVQLFRSLHASMRVLSSAACSGVTFPGCL